MPENKKIYTVSITFERRIRYEVAAANRGEAETLALEQSVKDVPDTFDYRVNYVDENGN